MATDTERLVHPEYPGSPYTYHDALYDLREAQDHLWVAERRAADGAPISTGLRAANMKLDRVRRFIAENVAHEPNLGLATTRQLIEELECRCRLSDLNGEAWPQYRTVDSQ